MKPAVSLTEASVTRTGRKRLVFAASAVLAVTVIALILIIANNRVPTLPCSWDDFQNAFESCDDVRVINMYDDLRLHRAKWASGNGSHFETAAARADVLIGQAEKEMTAQGRKLIQKAESGARWTDRESFRVACFSAAAGAAYSKDIHTAIERYLAGEIGDGTMQVFAENILTVAPFRQVYGSFLENGERMTEARAFVSEVIKAGEIPDRELQLKLLSDMQKKSSFSASRPVMLYAERASAHVKNLYFDELMPLIRTNMEHNRTYDAAQQIKRLKQWLPGNDELLRFEETCRAANPEKVVIWRHPVEHLSIKPIIADPRRAFDGDRFQNAAERDLLLVSELDRALDELYARGYVLVDGLAPVSDSGTARGVPCPEGKKPLVLVLEDFYCSAPRTESGIARRLDLDSDGRITGVVLDKTGEERTDRSFSAIGVIESFIDRHPDFSFNGATGVIAAVGKLGLFGYPLSAVQELAWKYESAGSGMSGAIAPSSDFEQNRTKVRAILDALASRNWIIASGSYGRVNVAFASIRVLQDDFSMWNRWIAPCVGSVKAFYYPFGDHAEQNPDKTALLKNQGFLLQSGHGITAYENQGRGYVYVSRMPLTGSALSNPTKSGIHRFMDASRVIDRGARP